MYWGVTNGLKQVLIGVSLIAEDGRAISVAQERQADVVGQLNCLYASHSGIASPLHLQ
jgi:hypothetical protein